MDEGCDLNFVASWSLRRRPCGGLKLDVSHLSGLYNVVIREGDAIYSGKVTIEQ